VTQTFRDLKFGHAEWQRLNRVGFVSEATTSAAFYLDNLRFERGPANP
jgi:hypothetical protein